MNDPITSKLAEIQARCEKATPGPWLVTGVKRMDETYANVKVRGGIPGCKWHIADVRFVSPVNGPYPHEEEEAQNVAAFIAASREDVPLLLRIVAHQAETIELMAAALTGEDQLAVYDQRRAELAALVTAAR